MTTSISIKNLHFKVTVDDIYSLFSKFGEVTECRLILNERNETRGFAFITFKRRHDAAEALKNLADFKFYGRPIDINWATQTQLV